MKAFLPSLLLVGALALPALAAEGPSRKERLRWAAEAHTLLTQKNYAEAAAWLEKAVGPGASEKDLAEWWPVLGRCYESLGNHQKALMAYQQAQQLKPKSVDRQLDLARVYARVELNDKAAELYEEVLKRDRQRKDVMRALLDIYVRAARWEDAKQLGERYLALEPQDAAAQESMARAEEALGQTAAAARRLEGVLAVRPTGEGYFQAGQLWARQDQFDLAERNFEKAAETKFSSPEFLLERGLLAWRRGDRAAADKNWKAALSAEPGMPAARFLLALNAGALEEMRRLAGETDVGIVKDLAQAYLQGKK